MAIAAAALLVGLAARAGAGSVSGSLGTRMIRMIRTGDKGSSVSALQRDLRSLGVYPGAIDGVYGPATTSAVTSFQKLHGLSATGAASVQTQILVVAVNEPTLRPGATGVSVGALQRRLEAWGDDIGPINDAFNPATRQALLWFQAGEGLPATGVVNLATWIDLLGMPPSSASPPSTGGPSGNTGGASGTNRSGGSSSGASHSNGPTSNGETLLGYWTQSSSSPADYVKNRRDITEIGPLWYSVRANGTVKQWWPTKVEAVVAEVHQNGGKVLALVNNMGGSGAMLENQTARKAAVDNLVSIVKANHLDGLNIDFEGITGHSAQGLVAFMQELHSRLHALGLMTTVDVGPRASTNIPQGSLSAAYDYAGLAPYVDQMAIMTYDEHGVGTGPGPVSALPWARTIVTYALNQGVPAGKILLGIADYGYNWSSRGTTSISAQAALLLASSLGVTPTLDPSSGEDHFSYVTSSGVRHTVWFEDSRSLPSKIAIIRADHLGGAALWVLGGEDPNYFPTLAKDLNPLP